MPIHRKTSGGKFAPISALAIEQGDRFNNISAAWFNEAGVFKKIFVNGQEYHDPAAYYNIANATVPSVGVYNYSGGVSWRISALAIPLNFTLTRPFVDVGWSTQDVIIMSTGERLITDCDVTDATQPSCRVVEYNGSKTVSLDSYNSTNTNFAVADRLDHLGVNNSEYSHLKVLLHPANFEGKYNQQFGVRWRWYSNVNSMYFEHVFTNKNMVITPLK